MIKMTKENIYVVRGSDHGGLAAYTNYKSALTDGLTEYKFG